MPDHDAQVMPFADVTDRWVLRCGCGLLAEYATRDEAEQARDDHLTQQNTSMAEIGCPECGFDGPHLVVDRTGLIRVIECANGECGIEFSDDPDGAPT